MNLKLTAIGIVIVGVFFGIVQMNHSAYKRGYSDAETKYKQQIAKANEEAAELLEFANAEIKKTQESLIDYDRKLIEQRLELENANREKSRIAAEYRAGIKRMSIAALCKSDPTGQGESARPAELSNQGRCELLPETAGTLLDIARGHREDVQKLNECLDRYNSVKDALNKP